MTEDELLAIPGIVHLLAQARGIAFEKPAHSFSLLLWYRWFLTCNHVHHTVLPWESLANTTAALHTFYGNPALLMSTTSCDESLHQVASIALHTSLAAAYIKIQ